MSDPQLGQHGERWTDPESTVTYDHYHHPLYPPGVKVRVSEAIRELHPLSVVAGEECIACWGSYAVSSPNPDMQAFIDVEERYSPHLSRVPVLHAGQCWLVEETYVQEVRV